MTQILLVCAMAPARPVLEEALPALAAAGVTVQVCVQNPNHRGRFVGLPTGELHVLSPKSRKSRKPPKPPKPWKGLPASRWSPIRIAMALEWRARLLLIRRAAPTVKPWLLASRDPWFRQTVQDSQVVVAMDRLAIYTTWRANRLKGDRRAFYGLPATLRHLSVSVSPTQS